MSEHTQRMDAPSTDHPGVRGDDAPLPVVTIWEEYGSGADALGRAVAEKLGLPYHEQAFSSEEIESEGKESGGRSAEGQSAQLESRIALAQVFTAMGGAYGGFEGRDIVATQEDRRRLITDNNDTVFRYAAEGGVIVGRNATVLLADRPRTVHVLLTADVETRIARAAEHAGITPERAAQRQKREDKVRSDMSKILYGWDPRQPDRYDIVINTARIPQDAVVDAIVHAAKVRAS